MRTERNFEPTSILRRSRRKLAVNYVNFLRTGKYERANGAGIDVFPHERSNQQKGDLCSAKSNAPPSAVISSIRRIIRLG